MVTRFLTFSFMATFFLVIYIGAFAQKGICSAPVKPIRDSIPLVGTGVNDFAGIFSEPDRHALDSVIETIWTKTKVRIVVVTIDTSFATKDALDDLTYRMIREWKVKQKVKERSVVFFISREYRTMPVRVGQYVKKYVSDNDISEMFNTCFTPNFKSGEYYKGILCGVIKLKEQLSLKQGY